MGRPSGAPSPTLRKVRFPLERLELDPCPCIALVLTARVLSTVAGLSLVITFEYGDHPRRSRCALAQARSLLCGARSAAVALRVESARSIAIGLQTDTLSRPRMGPRQPCVTCRGHGNPPVRLGSCIVHMGPQATSSGSALGSVYDAHIAPVMCKFHCSLYSKIRNQYQVCD